MVCVLIYNMQRSLYVERGKLNPSLLIFPLRTTRNRKLGEFPGRCLFAWALILACWMVFSLPSSAAQQFLKGHVPRQPNGSYPIPPWSRTRLYLAIGLPLRNREELTNLLEELYEPGNANFRHYLTPEQFTASFGPSQEATRR